MKKQGITPTVILTGIITLVVIGMVVVFLNSAGFSSWVKNLPTWGDDSDVVVVSTDYTGGDRSIPETEGGYKECKYVVGRIQGGGGKLAVTNLAESSTSELELDDLFLINQGEDLDLSLKVAWVDRENLNGYLIYSSDDLLYGLLPGTPGRFKLGAISNGIISLSSTPEAIDIVATARSTPRLDLSVLNGAFIGNENKICRDTNLQLDSLMLARIEMGKIIQKYDVQKVSQKGHFIINSFESNCLDSKTFPVMLRFKHGLFGWTSEEINFMWDERQGVFIQNPDTLEMFKLSDFISPAMIKEEFSRLESSEVNLVWIILSSHDFNEFALRIDGLVKGGSAGVYIGRVDIFSKPENRGGNRIANNFLYQSDFDSTPKYYLLLPEGNYLKDVQLSESPSFTLIAPSNGFFSIDRSSLILILALLKDDYYFNWLSTDAKCKGDNPLSDLKKYKCFFKKENGGLIYDSKESDCWLIGSRFCKLSLDEENKFTVQDCFSRLDYSPENRFYFLINGETRLYKISEGGENVLYVPPGSQKGEFYVVLVGQ